MTIRTLYDAGWDDGLTYHSELTELKRTRAGWGMMLMLLGSILVACTLTIPFSMWLVNDTIYNPMPLVYLVFSTCGMIIGGYYLDKRDEKRYKQRETDFYTKWVNRWDELGFSGD